MPELRNILMRSAATLLALAVMPDVVGSVALAQEVAQSEGIETIVVNARKRSEDVQKTPIAITAVSAADMQRANITEVPDLGRITPSLTFSTVSYDSFDAFVTLRGISVTDVLLQQEPSVGIYIDGVYEATSLGTQMQSLKDIDHVEVLKGPQGTLYGRNTTGGAVNIYTKLPSYDGVSGDATVGIGNYSYYETSGDLNVPIVAEKVALRLDGQYSDQGDGFGYDEENKRQLDDPMIYNFRAALRLNPTDDLEIVLRGDYSHGKTNSHTTKLVGAEPGATLANEEVGLETGLGFGAFTPAGLAQSYARLLASVPSSYYDAALAPGSGNFAKVDNAGGSLTATYNFNPDLSLKSITAYRWLGKTFAGDVTGAPFDVLVSNDAVTDHQLSQEFNLNGNGFDNKLKYIVGAYYFYSTGYDDQRATVAPDLFGAFGLPQTINQDVSQATSKAIFSQATYTIVPGLSLTGGLRETWDNKTLITSNRTSAGTCLAAFPPPPIDLCSVPYSVDFSNTSYTASLDYSVTDDTLVYARTGRAYKAGGFNEREQANVGLPYFKPFAPEVDTDYEVGVKSDLLDRKLRIDADLYHSEYDQIQETQIIVGIGGNPESVIGNFGRAHIDGAEFELDAKPTEALLLRATGSYAGFSYDEGAPPGSDGKAQGVPKFQGSLSATYTVPTGVGPLELTSNWSWLSRVDFQTPNHDTTGALPHSLTQQGSYGLLDAHATLFLDNDTVEVTAWAKNILDRHYIVGALDLNGLGYAIDYLGAPATFGFTLTKHFGPYGNTAAATPEPPPAPPAPVPPPAVKAPEAQRSFQVFFDFDKSNITEAAAKVIQAAADAVKAGNVVQITVTGHTDTVGTASYNQGLSERRATAAKRQLVSDGVADGEITTIGVGKTGLLVPTGDGVREPQNRRAEIVLQ